MNRMKKFASIMLALVMAFALMAPAFASGNSEGQVNQPAKARITAPSNDHKYAIYQIFTGDLATKTTGEGENQVTTETLSNVKWGTNAELPTGVSVGDPVSSTVLEELMGAASGTDSVKLAVIEKYVDLNSTPVATIGKGAATSEDVDTGYYLIKDLGETGEDVGDGEQDSTSLNVVQVVGSFTIRPKTTDTTLEKKVQDTNDSADETDTPAAWEDSADYDIGDSVPFKLTATLGERVSDYEKYYLEFNDTLSDGLTFNSDSVKVTLYVDGNETNTSEANVKDLTNNFIKNIEGQKMTLTCTDVKALGATNNSKIIVTYTATLGENAVIGGNGNTNTASLKYSRDPNWDGTGEEPKGETPDDTVVVFTFQATLNKVDQDNNALAGAGFTLLKYDPKMYNDLETSTEKKSEEEGWIIVDKIDAADGKTTFEFKGLDDGRYKLIESTTPAGYNTMDPVYFVIEAEHDKNSADPKLTSLTVTQIDAEGNKITTGNDLKLSFTSNTSTGTATTNVQNNKGATLPETGGIGTTIFYALGGVMAVGAVVLLVTKKRMNADK